MDQELQSQEQSVPELQEAEKRRKEPKNKKSYRFATILRWLSLHRQVWLVLLPAAALVFALVIAPMIGSSVGTAVGSWNGVTEGLTSGYEDGKEEGLSAKDTITKISTTLSQTQKLQVLLVDLTLSDLYTQGSPQDPTYAALFKLCGEGVFAVDLSRSITSEGSVANQIQIKIPKPEFTPYLDDSTIEKVENTEYKAPWYKGNGSTADGYTGWLNTRTQLDRKVTEKMAGYDAMMEQAQAAALKQVERLARSICGSDTAVEVCFFEEGEG